MTRPPVETRETLGVSTPRSPLAALAVATSPVRSSDPVKPCSALGVKPLPLRLALRVRGAWSPPHLPPGYSLEERKPHVMDTVLTGLHALGPTEKSKLKIIPGIPQ